MDEPDVEISELDAHPIIGAKTGRRWTKFSGENDTTRTITILNEDVCDLDEWI